MATVLGSTLAAAAPEHANSAPNPAPAAPRSAGGKFKFVYSPVKKADYKEWQAELQKEKTLELMTTDLNNLVAIPADVTLTYAECGEESGTGYTPDDRTITLCYEDMDSAYEEFEQEGKKDDALDEAVVNVMTFALYHELGHALIDVLAIPVIGREEDAADQMATFILADGSDEGEQAALDGAIEFSILAKQEKEAGEEPMYWDEHSLNPVRFINIVCWLYGENPDKFQHLVKDDTLPEERAEQCADEWEKLSTSWTKLLGANLKIE